MKFTKIKKNSATVMNKLRDIILQTFCKFMSYLLPSLLLFICAPEGLSPLENLFLTKSSRNNIGDKSPILKT